MQQRSVSGERMTRQTRKLGGGDVLAHLCLGASLALSSCSAGMSPLDPESNVFVKVTGSGSGSGSVASVQATATFNINCHFPSSSSCDDDFYDAGAGGEIRLRATPDGGSTFEGWTGDCASFGTADTCVLTFTEAQADASVTFTVGVTFALEPPPPGGPGVVYGTMLGGDGVTPLPGITVNVSGFPGVITDEQGEYRIDVTAGNLNIFASGICDPVHTCDFELSYNSTEAEHVTAVEGQEVEKILEAQRGYHFEITGGADNQSVPAGETFTVQLDYVVWNRWDLPGATPRITLGIDDAPGPSPGFLQPGRYPGIEGSFEMTLTAPSPASTPTDYGVYALLVTATASVSAASEYERLYPNGRLFVRLFTLTVE
jgi:hypothetical protein